MANLLVTSEHQIQQLNRILSRVSKLRELPSDQLTQRPNQKSWSILEILEHLNIAYEHYVEKIDAILSKLPDKSEETVPFKVRSWQGFVIQSARPKNNKRKLKIKTLKRFEPELKIDTFDQNDIEMVFDRFENLHLHLKNAIINSRTKEVSKHKITSAIGAVVTFYLPECFEFLLVHLERHIIQINDVIQEAK